MSSQVKEGKILGILTFVASALPHNECGSNGLPLTPNSIKVLGRAQILKKLRHRNLCEQVEFYRGKHDRIFSVVEHHENDLQTFITRQKSSLTDQWNETVLRISYEVLQGLKFLHGSNVEHHNLQPNNILLDASFTVKLSNYGLYHMTDSASLVNFPVGDLKYLAPEEILALSSISPGPRIINYKSDVWPLGIIILQLALGENLFENVSPREIVSEVLSLCTTDDANVVDELLRISNIPLPKLESVSTNVLSVVQHCLQIRTKNRPTPSELILSKPFDLLRQKYPYEHTGQRTTLFSEGCDCSQLNVKMDDCKVDEDQLGSRDLDEIFHLWQLAGGDIMSEVKRHGSVHSIPAILTLPQMMSLKGDVMGFESFWANLYDFSTTIISLDTLRKRLENIPAEAYYPLLESSGDSGASTDMNSEFTAQLRQTSELPLAIKERDIEYQLSRVFLYKRLLLGYPYLRDRIWQEARVDIPPHYRGMVWASLLDVAGDVKAQYANIDKETPLSADRQIAVDIPRCHQYDALLSSPTAHNKFKRVIKAWLKSHPHLTYWQGLDSLCAAFLHLNFNSEHLAWSCMSKFIDKFLHNFFLKDNSAIIQEYLAVFCHLIAFHDPTLANHLSEIEFFPELYSIPWFLTMFTHVFPLQKIAHLWDTLLLGNSSFPLCVGVAILRQLRSQLLSFGFNECILLFSDLPEIDIDNVVQESVKIFCNTPKSATFRAHAKTQDKPATDNRQYYGSDYTPSNTTMESELDITGAPLAELKERSCPRISAQDLIELSDLRSSTKTNKPKILILDVRTADEFLRAAIPESLNVPYSTALAPDGQTASLVVNKTIRDLKPKVIVVAGSKNNKDDILFSKVLVKQQYKGVCTLHNGIDVLRSTGLLTVQ